MKKLLVRLFLGLLLIIFITGCGSNTDKGSLRKEGNQIPMIPHSIEDKKDCAVCHKYGKNKAKPTKHINRPNCIQCHKVK